jgi:hypothetical protein
MVLIINFGPELHPYFLLFHFSSWHAGSMADRGAGRLSPAQGSRFARRLGFIPVMEWAGFIPVTSISFSESSWVA